MRVIYFLACFAIFCANSAFAQNDSSKPKFKISFNNKRDTIYRVGKGEDEPSKKIEILDSNLKADSFKNDSLYISVDANSSFLSNNYLIVSNTGGTLSACTLNEIDKLIPLRIIIKEDDPSFPQALPVEIVLTFKVKKKEGDKWISDDANNEGKFKTKTIVVMPKKEALYTYKYLGYLGTNFDLVDGVQARNLFFATNILIPETHLWGFNLSIYGNRTMTKTDTSKQTTFESRIVKINNDSIARYFDTALKVTTRVSDNIGANFLPLIHIKELDDGALHFYYAPQFEFIWRRTTIDNAYLNSKTTRIDSSKSRFPANTAFPLITPLSTKVNFNVYDVYMGLIGIFLRYENEDISIRVNSSVGINYNFTPLGALSSGSTNSSGTITLVNPVYQKDRRFFFFGRLWITEPTTGLTLGAEVSNYFGSRMINGVKTSNAQPYYNVTLSKAFNLKNLAAVVKPLTNK